MHLKRGPAGHRELFRAVGKLDDGEWLPERIEGDPDTEDRQLYNRMRFLVRNEKELISLLETMLTGAAADAQWVRELSPDISIDWLGFRA